MPPQINSMTATQKDSFYAFEVSITPSDLNFLNANPEKSAIWLSRKMQEKGKEARWSQLSMDQKKNYDISQAKELSNVLSSRALRSLTSQEWDNLDYSKVMSMRWVLTTKNDGSTKARLVVLGFQMAGIGEVQTAAPTMARVSRNLLLTICANNRFKLRAGDVTATFLQTSESLEDLDLTVWAPAELAVAANPENPVMPIRISKAFYGLFQSPRCWYNDVSSKMKSQGWKCILADRCLFVLYDEKPNSPTLGQIIGIAGLHVDDFLVGGIEEHPRYAKAFADLQSTYNWGKWQSDQFEFAGCHITQLPDSSIRIDQEDYVTKWVDEIQLPKDRMTQTSSALTPREISMLRGAIGSLSWKSAQTGPHFQAEACLLLSEVPHATISTIVKVNMLIREVKREASQSLLFPAWGVEWHKMAIVTWCDAGEKNRPDESSTLGHITGIAPAGFLQGEPHVVAILNWKSGKTPRQCLGSNGAEVQATTEGEDITFKVRAMWAELHGVQLRRATLYEQVRDAVQGAIVMDSRGIFDAMSRNISSLHGLRSSRSGYELMLSVQQAVKVSTAFRWVNGLAQLADCLTKSNERKMFLQFLVQGQTWRLVHDDTFTAGKKLRKQELERSLQKREEWFIGEVRKLAKANKWPWIELDELRNKGDELTDHIALTPNQEYPLQE